MKNIFIISGAAGSGKDSVIDKLKTVLDIERIITTTTRAMRPGEREGQPYAFISRDRFKHGIVSGDFVEYSINENDEYYGVTKKEIERIVALGKTALWRVDWKGVVNIKNIYPEIPAIYISAPIDILEKRLRTRDAGQSEAYFEERMAYTREWLKHLDIYDYQIENEEGKLDAAVAAVKAIIEKHLESA